VRARELRRARARDESGLALLSALLTIALLTIIVIEFADSALIHAHLSRNAGNALAAQLLARSAVVGAEAVLTQDQNDEYLDYVLGVPIPIPTNNGSVTFMIQDEDGKLDLNQIADKNQRAALENLFTTVGVDPALLDRIEAWVAKADTVEAEGATEYCSLPMPCEPRHRPLSSLDELRLIEGFDERSIERLRPFVTAFGAKGDKGVNVNTARPEVLSAMGCGTSGGSIEVPPGGFENQKDAKALCPDAKLPVRIKGKYFSIQSVGTVGDVSQRVDVIVQRSGSEARRLFWRERPAFSLSPSEAS
jgi:general secretion pathway protein K